MHRSARLSVLIAALLEGRAIADDEEPPSEATVLFAKGREAVKAGRDAEACPLFEQSQHLAPALGTELNLARCWATTGKLVDALHMFQKVEAEATGADQGPRAQLARDGLAELAGRVPQLTIQTGALPTDVKITVDGKPVDAGQAFAVDPGPRRIEAAGARPVVYTAREGALGTITLQAASPPPRPPEVWILGGVAVGALAIGSITGLVFLSERSAAVAHCGPGDQPQCDERGVTLLNRAHAFEHLTTAMYVIGLGTAAAAVYFELHARTHAIAPLLLPEGGGGAVWLGRF